MNYLQLVQRLAREAGTAAPSSTVSQVGESLRFVNWLNAAWVDIQSAHPDWRWMRKEATINTVASDGSYAYTEFTDVASAALIAAGAFSHWLMNDAKKLWTCYLSSGGQSGETDLLILDFDTWRFLYNRGAAASTTGKPVYVTVAPDNTIKTGPLPDAVYVVRGWYQAAATELSGDADVPELPVQYHLVLVWKALMQYGLYESAPESYAQGKAQFDLVMGQLELNQLPRITKGDPLVE